MDYDGIDLLGQTVKMIDNLEFVLVADDQVNPLNLLDRFQSDL